MKRILLILLIFPTLLFGQSRISDIIGLYSSVNNKFEKWSIMELKDDRKFVYKYGLGGCQAEVTGTYIIIKDRIRFKNSTEFTKEYIKLKNDSLYNIDPSLKWIGYPMYPDLSKTEWKIRRKWIQPVHSIDCDCFIEKGKHMKK